MPGTSSAGRRRAWSSGRSDLSVAVLMHGTAGGSGVGQAGIVLRCTAQARDRGVGVVFITHNPHHAHPVGDRFLLLGRGRSLGDFAKGEVGVEELTRLMAGGAELDELAGELARPQPEKGRG